MILINIIKATIVRVMLSLHVFITVWRVTIDLHDTMYWLLALLMIPFFIEALYTIIKRHGTDFRLFTPCFFFYLMTTIPCIWLLELKKSDTFLDEEERILKDSYNASATNSTEDEFDPLPDIGVDINPGTWTVLIEEFLLYFMIVSRWLLPRGKVTREQLSDLLFAFIGIASDIMEMFSLFGLEDVRKNRTLSFLVLGCWTVSVLQFCMTVTVIHEPKKAKVIKTIDDNNYDKEKPKIWNEILAIFCSMMMQDIPFLALRLYTITTYHIMNYSLIFFTAKNVLVICLLLYKIVVLLQKRYCPEFLEDDEEEEEVYIGDNDHKKNGKFHHMMEESSDDSRSGKAGRGNGVSAGVGGGGFTGNSEKQAQYFYTDEKDGSTNKAFQRDPVTPRPVTIVPNEDREGRTQLPMAMTPATKPPGPFSQPNESTPLRKRRQEGMALPPKTPEPPSSKSVSTHSVPSNSTQRSSASSIPSAGAQTPRTLREISMGSRDNNPTTLRDMGSSHSQDFGSTTPREIGSGTQRSMDSAASRDLGSAYSRDMGSATHRSMDSTSTRDDPVSSGYGWVSSKPRTGAK